MKTNVFMAMAITIAVVTSLTLSAQPQRVQPYSGRSPREIPQVRPPMGFTNPSNLNEQQRAELQKIQTEQLKERTQTSNLLREKHAKLEALQTADKPNLNEINKVIDEIAAIQAQEMKAQAAARQKVRNLLTDEQRVLYDARTANRGNTPSSIYPGNRNDRIRRMRTD